MFYSLNSRLIGIIAFIIIAITFSCKPKKEPALGENTSLDAAFDSCIQWRNLKEADRVHHYLDSVYEKHSPVSDEYLVRKYYYLADMYFNQIQHFIKTGIYLDSVEMIGFNSPELVHIQIQYNFLRGQEALQLREYEKSCDYFLRGKNIIDSLGDDCWNDPFYLSMAYLHFRQEKYKEALRYYLLRKETHERCDTTPHLTGAFSILMGLNNIGLCYERLGICDSASYYYQKGIEEYQQFSINHPEFGSKLIKSYGVILGNWGGCLAQQGLYDSAKAVLQRSIAINFEQKNEIRDAILTKIKLADVYFETNQFNLCETLLSDISNNLKEYHSYTAEQRFTDIAHRFYTRTGKYDLAQQFLQRNYILRDSIKFSGYLVDSKYDFEREVDQLKKEMDIVQLKHSNHQKNMLIFIISVLLIAGIGIAIALNLKRKQQKENLRKLEILNNAVTRNNRQLQISLSALEQSQSENSRILKILAHDLRSPIAGIVNAIRVLRHNHLEPEESQKILDLVEKSSLNSLDFVDDLLNLNEDYDKIPKEKVDLSVILDTCLQLHLPQANEKGVNIRSQLMPVFINANQQRIWRVFNNILVNAIKFTPGGKTIRIQTEINANSVCVSIKDEGIGIPEPLKDKIFNMFSEAGRPGTEGEKSFGLGLAISKQIIESHKGRIWFESSEGLGTEFFVELPVAGV